MPSQKTAEQHPYVLKEKNCHSSILYPAKMFQKQGQSKDFFRHTTMEGIHHQQTWLLKAVPQVKGNDNRCISRTTQRNKEHQKW